MSALFPSGLQSHGGFGGGFWLYSSLTSPEKLWLGLTWQWKVLRGAGHCHDQFSLFGLEYIFMLTCFEVDVPDLSFNYISVCSP